MKREFRISYVPLYDKYTLLEKVDSYNQRGNNHPVWRNACYGVEFKTESEAYAYAVSLVEKEKALIPQVVKEFTLE